MCRLLYAEPAGTSSEARMRRGSQPGDLTPRHPVSIHSSQSLELTHWAVSLLNNINESAGIF